MGCCGLEAVPYRDGVVLEPRSPPAILLRALPRLSQKPLGDRVRAALLDLCEVGIVLRYALILRHM